MVSLDWPQAVAAIGIAATVCTAIAQVVLKLYQPQGSPGQRERRENDLAGATAGLTKEVESLRRDMEAVKDRLNKLIDLTIQGMSKDDK